MKTCLRFLADETGAVTVDWVVLTSITLLLVLLGMTFLGSPVSDLTNDIGGLMQDFHNTLNTP